MFVDVKNINMKNIFIFTAGNTRAQVNLDISIKNPIKKDLVWVLLW